MLCSNEGSAVNLLQLTAFSDGCSKAERAKPGEDVSSPSHQHMGNSDPQHWRAFYLIAFALSLRDKSQVQYIGELQP